MTVTFKELVESYNRFWRPESNSDDKFYYRQDSEKKARDGLDATPYSKEDVEEYITGDTEELSKYNTSNGRHLVTGKPYDRELHEFNSIIAQPYLTDHQKVRVLHNLIRHNALLDARGGGEPHEYATDIQERELFNDYNPNHGILPNFDDMHDAIENENKHYNSLSR